MDWQELDVDLDFLSKVGKEEESQADDINSFISSLAQYHTVSADQYLSHPTSLSDASLRLGVAGRSWSPS